MVMLAVVTVWAFTGTGLDIKVSAHYFNPSAAKPFSLHLVPPWTWLYDFVFIPLTVVLIGVLGAFIASLRNSRWRRWRLYAFFVLIALGLGPGLMVNGVLKAWWGRPRPRQIEQFRGPLKYHDAVSPGDISGRGKSFPCGHSSAGYFLSVFYFIYRRRHAVRRWLALGTAVAAGTALGWGRIMAGQHFLSDVIWSALVVFSMAWLAYYFIFNVPGREDSGEADQPATATRRRSLVLIGLLVIAAIALSLAATPYSASMAISSPRLSTLTAPPEVRIEAGECSMEIAFDDIDHINVEGQAEGFGWAGSKVMRRITVSAEGGASRIIFHSERQGLFTELQTRFRIVLPAKGLGRIDVAVAGGELVLQSPDRPIPPMRIELKSGVVRVPESLRPAGIELAPTPAHVIWEAGSAPATSLPGAAN